MGNARKERRRAEARQKEHEAKKNKGGFYKGMEGVWLDEHGNRRIYEISVTPDGDVISRHGCDPKLAFICFADLMKNGDFSRAFILKLADQYRKEQQSENKKPSRWEWLKFWKKKPVNPIVPPPTPTSQLSDLEYAKKLEALRNESNEVDELEAVASVQPVNLTKVENES